MITSLYKFAELLKNKPDLQTYYTPAENPFEGRESNGKVFVGIIEDQDFKGFELEDFNPNFINKYLYRRPAGARGTNTVPTLVINKQDPTKTFGKIKQSFTNLKPQIIEDSQIEKIETSFLSQDFNSEYSFLVTFKIDGVYFGDKKDLVAKFNSEAYTKYFKKNYGNSKKKAKLCALTGKTATVYGFVDTLGFTVDADSFRRNGFDASNSYKMFPVSELAIPTLEGARGILMNKLAANFFGQFKYAIIPHFVFLDDQEIGKIVAHTFLQKAAFNTDSKDSGTEAFINDSESLLKEIIGDKTLNSSDILYAILFFEQQQAQFKIHLEITDVLPSRIKKVIDSKQEAENRYKWLTTYQTKDGNIVTQRITLFRLKEYFQTGEKNLQPAYFKLISSIFTGQPFDDSKLLTLILNTWKSSYKKNFNAEENRFNTSVKHALANLHFLHLLGLFKKLETMPEVKELPEKQDAFGFIEGHPTYFSKEYLKGSFLFGCLTARLLYNQPGNAFMKELNGLNIDKELITKKFPKLISKLRQFSKEFPDLEAAAQRYFAVNDKATKEEISFAFTMGLVLQKDFDKNNKAISNLNSDKNE
ncbi:CRISPR-associated protein, TM1802 family [Cyclobacterium xiamenense]|uniref:CRISPR-associated protein, TM1802 family n=1 Tax=Cyclobacterium xiamenense TaxID=1297121 RepID=A0A1H7AWN7_9BACT|nr:TM1802 family CRISPR-associated protein [Cyclobacterium xiamenense]SEJ66290.1 CRISPR-associated protein, TM1802 family [Cyclobacterium xiamenense]